MQIFLLILSVILLVPTVLFLRDYFVRCKLERLAQRKYLAMQKLLQNIGSGKIVEEKDVLPLAMNASLRLPLFRLLNAYDRLNIFPQEFNTVEKAAESYMVNWLEYPTELGQAPDEIFLLENVAIEADAGIYYYYVFRFRADHPQWARKLEWMLGVCGPYDRESAPFDVPSRVFSRFKQLEYANPGEEVQWVHNNINV